MATAVRLGRRSRWRRPTRPASTPARPRWSTTARATSFCSPGPTIVEGAAPSTASASLRPLHCWTMRGHRRMRRWHPLTFAWRQWAGCATTPLSTTALRASPFPARQPPCSFTTTTCSATRVTTSNSTAVRPAARILRWMHPTTSGMCRTRPSPGAFATAPLTRTVAGRPAPR